MNDKITLHEEDDHFVARLETTDQFGSLRIFVVCPVCTEPLPDAVCTKCRRMVCGPCTVLLKDTPETALMVCTDCSSDGEL